MEMVWSPQVLAFRSKHTMEAFSGEDFARKKVVFNRPGVAGAVLQSPPESIMGLMGHNVVLVFFFLYRRMI